MAWAVKSPPLRRDSIIGKKAKVELIADTGRGIEETGVCHQEEGERFSRAAQMINGLMSTETEMAHEHVNCLLIDVLKVTSLGGIWRVS